MIRPCREQACARCVRRSKHPSVLTTAPRTFPLFRPPRFTYYGIMTRVRSPMQFTAHRAAVYRNGRGALPEKEALTVPPRQRFALRFSFIARARWLNLRRYMPGYLVLIPRNPITLARCLRGQDRHVCRIRVRPPRILIAYAFAPCESFQALNGPTTSLSHSSRPLPPTHHILALSSPPPCPPTKKSVPHAVSCCPPRYRSSLTRPYSDPRSTAHRERVRRFTSSSFLILIFTLFSVRLSTSATHRSPCSRGIAFRNRWLEDYTQL